MNKEQKWMQVKKLIDEGVAENPNLTPNELFEQNDTLIRTWYYKYRPADYKWPGYTRPGGRPRGKFFPRKKKKQAPPKDDIPIFKMPDLDDGDEPIKQPPKPIEPPPKLALEEEVKTDNSSKIEGLLKIAEMIKGLS